MSERPWNLSAGMTSEQLQEEARAWGVNAVVFTPSVWQMYEPLFRADFQLFDSQTPPVRTALNKGEQFVTSTQSTSAFAQHS